MRNLKKILALALALVMSMSLMAVANASDFSDDADIEYQEAVEVMTALEVIDGVGNNTFNPKGNVTRAQMAKMITIVSLGNVDAAAFTGTVTDLKDIDGHWAEAFIKYCYSQGIIAGKGGGVFAPNANVTAAEAAKMLLVAIGYNSDVQGYEGSQWAINVTRDAQLSGFYEDLSVTANQALTREQAAQMIYNAVGATLIEATPNWNASTGTVTYTYEKNTRGATLLSETFDAKEYVGVMNTISYASSNEKYSYDGTADFENKVSNTDKHNGSPFITTDDYTALEGEEVSIIVKTERNGDETVLGIYPTGKSTVINANVSALSVDGAKVKYDGTSYELEGTLTTAMVVKNSYNTIKLVDSDDNGKLDTAVTTTVTPGKVTYVSDKEVIAGGTTYKFADDEIPAGLAKDDYVAVVKKLNGVNVLTKLDAIEGTVTSDKTNTSSAADDQIEVNGVWYNDSVAGGSLALGSTYKFYAVNGVMVANSATVVSGATISNLVMLLDHDNTSTVLSAQALIMDGTGEKKTVTIDKSGISNSLTDGELYFYEETSAGYKFSAPKTTDDNKYTWAADGTLAISSSTVATIDSTKSISDDAVIFVYTPGDENGAVITGKQLKSLTVGGSVGNVSSSAVGSFTSTINGLTRVTYAGVALASTSDIDDLGVTSGNTAYAYVTSTSYQTRLNNDTYVTYSIWNGSENVTVFEKGTTVRSKGDVMKYDTIGADNIITGVSVYSLGGFASPHYSDTAAIYGMEGDYIFVDGSTVGTDDYKLTSDTKYLYIDSNASDADSIGMAGGEVVLADKYTGLNFYMDNVILVTNSSKEVVLLVVDVKNNMNNPDNAIRTATASGITGVTPELSKTSGIKTGDAVELTLTNSGASTVSGNLTLNYCRTADSNSNTVSVTVPANSSVKITVFAQGDGNIVITGALTA